ncbi:hypothetical protein EJ05DRAFT_145154 [Pseudovirgaria hyperparasitica]|uniref:1,3-beta-glucanosyltransferase n=1 Tax=Pseudovirgaria hyperparasitica TaxID=470096 RepID=A0A6A6VZ27_9PEZI|nr:uncharacterized protein EJ05DRAFT_145154 [Pseudovirgaria hyperparasitica]KAF2754567.1 hypothetical protein EJ05DRAFT_145154 [Pseudovirgaria hyperparasitica]
MSALLRFVAVIAAALGVADAVRPVEVRQQEFVIASTGSRFMLLGVDYQPGGQAGYKPQEGSDALTDGDVCLRDAIVMQNLGVNTIRVYNIDPSLNHDKCASIFNAAGIYILMDVNSPFGGESIDRSNPSSSYHVGYLERVFRVVEAFKGFPNTLGFFAANEVMNDVGTSADNPPYIRAVQRDLKQYIANHAERTIPVGYSAADVREILQDSWEYLQCAIDGDQNDQTRSDFFGLNSYSWCGGDATFDTSGYDDLVTMFSNTTVPVFFSEYGCNEVKPRVFDEVQALYGPQMTVLSGGLVYEYSQEEADYGLVVIHSDRTVNLRTDFDNLESQYSQLNITLIESANGTATSLQAPTCSDDLITNSAFSKSFDIPSQPDGVADMIRNGVSNPQIGKLVEVTATSLPMKVYGTNGNEVNFQLKILSDESANTPGNNDGGSDANTGNGGDEGGSDRLRMTPAVLLGTILAVVLTLL